MAAIKKRTPLRSKSQRRPCLFESHFTSMESVCQPPFYKFFWTLFCTTNAARLIALTIEMHDQKNLSFFFKSIDIGILKIYNKQNRW